jgi:hypothetical protein
LLVKLIHGKGDNYFNVSYLLGSGDYYISECFSRERLVFNEVFFNLFESNWCKELLSSTFEIDGLLYAIKVVPTVNNNKDLRQFKLEII